VPSIPQIAEELDLTHAVVRYVLYAHLIYHSLIELSPSLIFSISIFASAIGALVWAAYSSFCACIRGVSQTRDNFEL
jgi:hypothetical protein